MNLLFVSIAFPPKGDPESLQVHKYVKYLAKKDVNISVVTSKNPTLFMEVDNDIFVDQNFFAEYIEVPIKENKIINFLKRKINSESLNYPDSKYSFISSKKTVIDKLKNVPEIIYSRSFPVSSTILAYQLANHYNVPWILHLSDPWIYKSKDESNLSKSEKWNLDFEEKCLTLATKVCLTSQKTIAFYKHKYPNLAHKFEFFANVYDGEDSLEVIEQTNSEKIIFTYTGGLTSVRHPQMILDILAKLYAKQPNLFSSIEFNFVGPKDQFVNKLINGYNLPFVNNIGLVSYAESKKYQSGSNFLMLFDSPTANPVYAMYFPSKILDYIQTRKNILAITPAKSTTMDVIKQNNFGYAFSHDQTHEIEAFLLGVLNQEIVIEDIKGSLPKEFEASFNVDKLYSLFLQYAK